MGERRGCATTLWLLPPNGDPWLRERFQVFQNPVSTPAWLSEWMETHGISLWGTADLRGFPTPELDTGKRFPVGLSFAIPVNPQVMAGIRNGPNEAYADEYTRLNSHIDELTATLAADIRLRDFHARPLAASERTDTVHIRGDFPQKTVATRAGLGWVGRHCQLITRSFGPWVRLGAVFTDMDLPCGTPIEEGSCGRCMRCVEACPAKALKGNSWHAEIPREEMLDVQACDRWKKEHYAQYLSGHICGICSAACPHGLKTLR
ncbi:MAG: 4Fe-4S binding protein [Dehalococcoidia bacterium]|nr:4Fe-4S binding protein [Dehalococcoidia bacterium]